MKKEIFEKIISNLNKMYPNVTVSLNYSSPFELLVCLILAAQCTDKRVNETTKVLFNKYKTINELALSEESKDGKHL